MKKAFIVTLGLATALVLTGCTLFYPNSGSPEDLIEPSVSASEAPAEETATEQSASPSPSPSPSVSPTMAPAVIEIRVSDASSGVLQVVAEITNIVEDGGSCSLSVYQGSAATVLATVKAERNTTSTFCSEFRVELSTVPKGPQNLTVKYESENHVGESEKFEVTIP
jgi:hypothetical protein